MCAPFWSTGGADAHLRSSGCTITCWSAAMAVVVTTSTMIANPAFKPSPSMTTSAQELFAQSINTFAPSSRGFWPPRVERRAEPDGDGALTLARQAERLVTENRDGGLRSSALLTSVRRGG